MNIKPYITFNGNAEEALNFYAACFNAEILGINRYETAPMDLPAGYENKVLHAELKIGEQSILCCDTMPGNTFTEGNNFSLSIDYPQIMELEVLFAKLAAGGKIEMPLQDTFWGARFGILQDKFGIRWMLNCDLN
ncbi:MAG: VOC family protein [Bacteroidia bacterium]